MTRLTEVLAEASSLVDGDASLLEMAANLVARAVQELMGVSRATLWVLEISDGRRILRRVGGFDSVLHMELNEDVCLDEHQVGPFLDRLIAETVYSCEDALIDPSLNAIRDTHLLPDDIRASISATVVINGQVTGVVSCAQRGQPRHWTAKDVATIRRVADDLALRHQRRQRIDEEALHLSGAVPLTAPPTAFSPGPAHVSEGERRAKRAAATGES